MKHCKTCGVEKKFHTEYQWKEHQRMHEAIKKLAKTIVKHYRKGQ